MLVYLQAHRRVQGSQLETIGPLDGIQGWVGALVGALVEALVGFMVGAVASSVCGCT